MKMINNQVAVNAGESKEKHTHLQLKVSAAEKRTASEWKAKVCYVVVLCLLFASTAFGQGARFDSVAQKTVQGFLAPIPGATITVCTAAGTGTPCTPVVPTVPITLCTDSTCAVAATNPFTADSNGNFGFWAKPGTYKVSVTAAGVTGYLLTAVLPISTAGSLAFGGPSPWIDITNPAYGATGNGSTDDTVAIQAAVSACPATGGTVFFPGTPNSYVISSKITLNTNCTYLGVGKASLITYKNPLTDSYPKLFCNGGTNVVITGLNLSNAVTPSSLILWGNSEATINGQEGFFCLGCQDLEIYNNIANNLGGAGILVVRGARERIHNNIANGNVHYGIYLLSDDNGTPTDDEIYANTCSNNGSFGNSGFQGRGIVATIAGSTLPVIGAVNTKIIGNTCNGNALYGIEVYRGASHTEIGWNTTTANGLGGIHEYNNTFSNVHHNNSYGNGLPNVPNEAGGTLPGITGYCIRQGGGYYSTISNNDCYGNNSGGGNVGQIVVNGEGDFTGAYGNAVINNQIRNNLGTGQDIFISATANFTQTNVQQFYKITAYDNARNVLAQSAEVNNTPAATSVNLLTWTPILNAASYVVCRGTATNAESIGYIAYGNAFLDEKAAALFTCSPPGSGTTITGVTLTNLTTAADTYNTILANNILVGTTTASSLSYSAFNTIAMGNITTASTTTSIPVTGSLNPTVDGQALGNSSLRWSPDITLAQFFRSGGAIGFPDIIGNGSAAVVIGDSNGTKITAAPTNFIVNSAGTVAQTLTLKKGSGAGNYTNATTSYTVADSTNLCLTLTIPTGWKLNVSASGALGTATAAVLANAALTDNAACSTANAGILVETQVTGTAATVLEPFALNTTIVGDGAQHNIALQFKTSNAADTATLQNSTATLTSTMISALIPSN